VIVIEEWCFTDQSYNMMYCRDEMCKLFIYSDWKISILFRLENVAELSSEGR